MGCITWGHMHWTDGLDQFLARFDDYAAQHLMRWHEHGHPDLPGYNPAMGPRYSVTPYEIPLSIFRGEGVILWALVRTFGGRVVETFTGTGVAACFLGAASRQGAYSVDDYREGGMGDVGWAHAQQIKQALAPNHLYVHRGSIDAVDTSTPISVLFSDGAHPAPFPARITVLHDEADAPGDSFMVPGTSLMCVQAHDMMDRAQAMASVATALEWLEAKRAR